MIQTSYFRAPGLPLGRCVAISLTVPRGYHGQRYLDLAPSRELLTEWKKGYLTWGQYGRMYREQVLDRLDPDRVYNDLTGAILLCWEKDLWHCHRSLVSTWLEEPIGEKVPEWPDGLMPGFMPR